MIFSIASYHMVQMEPSKMKLTKKGFQFDADSIALISKLWSFSKKGFSFAGWMSRKLISVSFSKKGYFRLNFGILRFLKSVWNLNLDVPDCRALKYNFKWFQSRTKLVLPISLELNIENPFLNFCVGVWVGGHLRTNFWYPQNQQFTESVSIFEIIAHREKPKNYPSI